MGPQVALKKRRLGCLEVFVVEVKTKTCPGKGKRHRKRSSQPPHGRCNLVICSCSAECPVLGKQRGNSQSYHSKYAKLQIVSAHGMPKSCCGCALTPSFSLSIGHGFSKWIKRRTGAQSSYQNIGDGATSAPRTIGEGLTSTRRTVTRKRRTAAQPGKLK